MNGPGVPVGLELSGQESSWLAGDAGPAMELAMRMMVAAAEVSGATEFVEIEFAHVGSAFYTGEVAVDFAEFLLAGEARFAVPTYTNASLIACETPELRPAASHPREVRGAQRLMDIYTELGVEPMWSCAPYAEPAGRPRFGAQIVGSESNAVSFFNSVLGARTNKYGDFIDVCAAMTGRVPHAGLHTDAGRLGSHVFDVRGLPDAERADPAFAHVLGIILGREAGSRIPVVVGIDHMGEDDLKAVAAAGATSGAVEMFHMVGVTPEAPTIEAATGGIEPAHRTMIDARLLAETRRQLSTGSGPIDAVCLGAPHFTLSEFGALRKALAGRTVQAPISFLVTTSRAVRAELQLLRWDQEFSELGVQVIVDTCTYFTPRPRGVDGLVMTNSAKWAYYAPGILGIEVAFGSLAQCVDAAVAGETSR